MPKTLGQHLKKRRMDLKLKQRHVAELIGVCRREVSSWEADQVSPHNRLMPRVFDFLGYTPIDESTDATVGETIRVARRRLGLSRDAAAELLGVSNVTISLWENRRVMPSKTSIKKVSSLLSAAESPIYA